MLPLVLTQGLQVTPQFGIGVPPCDPVDFYPSYQEREVTVRVLSELSQQNMVVLNKLNLQQCLHSIGMFFATGVMRCSFCPMLYSLDAVFIVALSCDLQSYSKYQWEHIGGLCFFLLKCTLNSDVTPQCPWRDKHTRCFKF